MSHTTGPWHASQYLDNGEWGVLNKDNVIVVGVSWHITKEDAQLIAAAPELLEACKAMVEDEAFEDLCQGIGEIPKWLELAKAAIYKARGRP
jgi:hypothetical protein